MYWGHLLLLSSVTLFTPLWATLSPQKLEVYLAKGEFSTDENKEILYSLLKEVQRKDYQVFVNQLETSEKALWRSYLSFKESQLESINAKSLQSRFEQYNGRYLSYLDTQARLFRRVNTLKERKLNLSLREKDKIVEYDLKIAASEDQLKQTNFVLFTLSLEAHESLRRAEKLFAKKDEKPVKISRPRMPGTYGGSREGRGQMTADEKINLTPVDPEFYKTQLGKKLEKDLNGRVDFWSYDYGKDDLYVKVGNELARIRVDEQGSATKIIKTRVGPGFSGLPKNYQGDERVDNLKAQGKFLRKKGDTLFGQMPEAGPKLSNEDEGGVKDPHEGHNH